jgi:hypothetical protein
LPIETLFIFGTNRSALQFVIEQLDRVERKAVTHTLSLERNEEQIADHRLLIPVFRVADHLMAEAEEDDLSHFEMNARERDLLEAYVDAVDERVLMARHGLDPQRIDWLRRSFQHPDDYYNLGGQAVGHLGLLVRRAGDYFGVVPKEFERLKDLDEEIRHFKRIKVSLRDIYGLRQKISEVKQYPMLRERLEAEYGPQQLSFEEMLAKSRELESARSTIFEHAGQRIKIEYIAQHYYVPTILADSERVDYIKHIIKVKSEVEFVNRLNKYVQESNNLFDQFDWWLFSKLDEHLDEIALPYYDPSANRIRDFKPDFIFWLRKGADYYIVFIDPKGTTYADYQHKVDGYQQLFEDGNGDCRVIDHEGLNVRVFTFLHTEDKSLVGSGYRPYWFDRMEQVLQRLLDSTP